MRTAREFFGGYAVPGAQIYAEVQIRRINPKMNRPKVLVTNYEKSKTSAAALHWLNKKSGQKLYRTVIRHSKAAKDSTIYRKPVPEYSIRSGAGQDYKRLVEEVLEDEA